jgi:hypothetical protein
MVGLTLRIDGGVDGREEERGMVIECWWKREKERGRVIECG